MSNASRRLKRRNNKPLPGQARAAIEARRVAAALAPRVVMTRSATIRNPASFQVELGMRYSALSELAMRRLSEFPAPLDVVGMPTVARLTVDDIDADSASVLDDIEKVNNPWER